MKTKAFWFTVRKQRNGRYVAKCPIGLWSVDAPTFDEACREGTRYFQQYADGGEYKDHPLPPIMQKKPLFGP